MWVNDKSIPFHPGQAVKAGADARTVAFYFGPTTNSDWVPNRIRYKLSGYDNGWREGNGQMSLTVRFYHKGGDQVSQKVFNVTGNSAGWNGSLKNSTSTHRRETVIVPRARHG